MEKRLFKIICVAIILSSPITYAKYELGCDDPDYHQYVVNQSAFYDENNRRLFSRSQREYQTSLEFSSNPYRAISDLSRHLRYSAQYDPINTVKFKIDTLLDLAENLRTDQKLAASVFDNFSSENHSVAIARAWVAYRQGNNEIAFDELIASTELGDSVLMSSFGPDFMFARQIYADGHVQPIVNYLKASESFWNGEKADELRDAWRTMIKAECKVLFQTFDNIKVIELGLKQVDLSQKYGID